MIQVEDSPFNLSKCSEESFEFFIKVQIRNTSNQQMPGFVAKKMSGGQDYRTVARFTLTPGSLCRQSLSAHALICSSSNSSWLFATWC